MYTIMMDENKNLITTVKKTIMQKENFVDKIQFLLPKEYEGMGLSEFIVTLWYVDPNQNSHSRTLAVEDELYKDFLRCEFDIDRNFVSVAGNVKVWLVLVNPNPDDDDELNMLRTNSTYITISKPNEYVDFADYEKMQAMEEIIKRNSMDISDLENTIPTDLKIDEDTEKLYIVHEDTLLGEGVEIIVPTDMDLDDDNHDGIVDLDYTPSNEEGNGSGESNNSEESNTSENNNESEGNNELEQTPDNESNYEFTEL